MFIVMKNSILNWIFLKDGEDLRKLKEVEGVGVVGVVIWIIWECGIFCFCVLGREMIYGFKVFLLYV